MRWLASVDISLKSLVWMKWYVLHDVYMWDGQIVSWWLALKSVGVTFSLSHPVPAVYLTSYTQDILLENMCKYYYAAAKCVLC